MQLCYGSCNKTWEKPKHLGNEGETKWRCNQLEEICECQGEDQSLTRMVILFGATFDSDGRNYPRKMEAEYESKYLSRLQQRVY